MRHAHISLAAAALLLATASPALCCVDDGSGGAGAGGGDTKPPVTPEKPAKAVKKVHVVWATPGHHAYAPGMLVRADADTAEALRAAGHARPASKEEVEAAKKAEREAPDFG